MNRRGLLYAGLGLFAGLLVLSTAVLVLNRAGAPANFHGSVLDPPAPAADFTLVDQRGRPFSLSAQRGNVVLLYFGYTSCPDECPLTLGHFKRASELLGAEAEHVRFVFVTVDPDVDTPAQLGKYLARFNPAFIGLTGDGPALAAAWQGYGVYHEKSPTGTLVDHTTPVYAIDPHGNLRTTYSPDTSPDDLVADVRLLLAGR